MPEVTVGPPRCAGKPIAITTSPSRSPDDCASATGTRSFALTRTTARSRSGAVPITVPLSGFACLSSLKEIEIPVVPSTTWLFVRISPSRWRITPDASPLPPPNEVVWTLTREGRTRATASARDPDRSGGAAGGVAVTVAGGAVGGGGAAASLSSPPSQPASSAAAAASATSLTAASGR